MNVRPTRVEVDLSVLRANFAAIKRHVSPARVMVVLKANAYGHGLLPVGIEMDAAGVDYLGVAYLEEGIQIRQAGVKAPILVLGGLVGEQLPAFFEHDLTITAPSVHKLEQIEAAAREAGRVARVHLKVDTGMERIGIHHYNAERLLAASLRCEHCEVEGIYTHFATADGADLEFAHTQLERFAEVCDFYDRRSVPMPLRHAANSGGVLQVPEAHLDMVRPGIIVYGVYPCAETLRSIEIRPAMTWRTAVVYFKVVEAGSTVSYGATWAPPARTRVVTLPVGYGDGYFRRMSGKARVLIGGREYPVVGRICMDQMMVDIGSDSAFNGDPVVLMGEQDGAVIDARTIADWAGTIPYEVLTNVGARVPRVYTGGITA